MTKKIALLGSTGSIGLSTLDVIRRHADRFEVIGLVGGSKINVLLEQIKEFKPKYVAVKEEKDAIELSQKISGVEILSGAQGAAVIAGLPEVDCVISAIVGAAGLIPTLAALKNGKIVGLANKESMVIAGEIMQKVARENGATILPVDSEHSALFQCLHGEKKESVRRLILTASGGPFFKKPIHEFEQITLAEALKHPNWNMGPKITIDSATMMNKGLEVMEARWLFDIEVDQIEICVHPQSIVHSMVDYIDGSVIAHLGLPDMRVPIAYALSYPDRIETGVKPLNLFEKKELTFFAPDFEKFPCLRIAYDVAKKRQTYPAVLNAANEVVVEAFLNQKIGF
ncbi:MAG: hypothetical protein ACD_73C00189G0007, partial [uncultured bacterium]